MCLQTAGSSAGARCPRWPPLRCSQLGWLEELDGQRPLSHGLSSQATSQHGAQGGTELRSSKGLEGGSKWVKEGRGLSEGGIRFIRGKNMCKTL